MTTPGPWIAAQNYETEETAGGMRVRLDKPTGDWRVFAEFVEDGLVTIVQIATVHTTVGREDEAEYNARLIASMVT